ncbi:MAG TPA: hypothetical protein VFD49_04195 [Candidatus Dormibacteraeota bacterium]|nr:hypothetical protein [Candidatus Dormibacteraeota bacterium]
MATTEGAIGIHPLGAADLGEKPEEYPQRLRDFLAAPFEERAKQLLNTRKEPHQSALSSIGSFLYHAPEPVTELWLVATNQIDVPPDDRRRRGDTLALAHGIREVLEQRPTLYGAACSVRVLEVRHFALAEFARVVREELEAVPRRRRVLVDMGSGGVEAFLGAFQGCLEAGYLPVLVPANRQDALDPKPFQPLVRRDVSAWLVRNGAFDAMAELHPDRESVWRGLAELCRYRWLEARKLLRGSQVEQVVGAPGGLGQRLPSRREQWTFMRAVLEANLLRQVGAGQARGVVPGHQWPELRLRELWHEEGLWTEDQRRAFRVAVERATEAAVGRHVPFEDCDLEAFLKRKDLWAGLPEPVAQLCGDPRWRRLFELSKRSGHWLGMPEPEEAMEAIRFLDRPDRVDPVADALEALGHPSPCSLPRDVLLITCVGRRDLQDGRTPMLDAVLDGVRERGVEPDRLHLRLLVSEELIASGQELAARALGAGLASAELVTVAHPADFQGWHERLVDHLCASTGLKATRLALVVTNPGTKAMNLAALTATLSWGFDTVTPVVVAPVHKAGDGSVLDLDLSPSGRAMARLAHDHAVGRVLKVALSRLDLDLAGAVVNLGSAAWAEVASDLQRYLEDVWGSDQDPPERRRQRFEARAQVCLERVRHDPPAALHEFCALAEYTWKDRSADWRDPRRGPRCRELWEWRNRGPHGHRLWASVPASRLDRAMRAAIEELHKRGFLSESGSWQAGVLIARRDRLLKKVEEVMDGLPSRG